MIQGRLAVSRPCKHPSYFLPNQKQVQQNKHAEIHFEGLTLKEVQIGQNLLLKVTVRLMTITYRGGVGWGGVGWEVGEDICIFMADP